MNFIHLDVPQGSAAWLLARCGMPTASRANAVQARGKNGEEAITRRDYRIQIATEMLTGLPQEDDYTNKWMDAGTELEPQAANIYEVEYELIEKCGFVKIDAELGRVYGCSPDRRAGWYGLVQIKCPKPATHVKYLTENRLPPAYLWQAVQEMMVVDSAQWYDFCSYCAQMPEGLQFWRVRIERKELEPEIRSFRVAMNQFLDDVRTTIELLEKLRARNRA